MPLHRTLCLSAPSLRSLGILSKVRTTVQSLSHVQLFATPWTVDCQVRGNSLGRNTGVGCYFLLQGIFLTQGSNPGLFHCRLILCCLNHEGSPLLSSSVQFSSVTQSGPTLCDPMNCSMPGLPVHHQLLEFTQTHVY